MVTQNVSIMVRKVICALDSANPRILILDERGRIYVRDVPAGRNDFHADAVSQYLLFAEPGQALALECLETKTGPLDRYASRKIIGASLPAALMASSLST